MKPQGMRFTVIDKDHAQIELHFAYYKLSIALAVIGIFVVGLGIWLAAIGGEGAAVIIIISLFFFIPFYPLYVWKKTLTIDKIEGKIWVRREIGILYHKVLYEWPTDLILEFEATQRYHGLTREGPSGLSSGSTATDVLDVLIFGTHLYRSLYVGYFVVKLKTGQIIHALTQGFPNLPQNCAKHANLFLKGEYTTPGTIIDQL